MTAPSPLPPLTEVPDVFEQAFKNIDDVLWKEAGCTTELDYTEQTSWLLFLKYLDALEQDKADEAALKGKKAAGICLVIQRDPIQTAKQVASLDLLAGGRFLFGVGGGWNVEEMANHGTRYETRWKLLRERIEAMKQIWTQKQAEYHGELVSFDPIFAWPKPTQKPHPRIHVGGAFPGGMRRALRYGDGWIPLMGRGDDDVLNHLPLLREEAAKAGRSLDGFEVSIYGAPPDAEKLRALRDAGIARVLFFVPPVAKDDALKVIDAYAETMRKVG